MASDTKIANNELTARAKDQKDDLKVCNNMKE